MDFIQIEELTKEYQCLTINSLQELGNVVFDTGNNLICLMQETQNAHTISKDELRKNWPDIKKHITLDEKAYLDDYLDNYFYFVELWRKDSGELLLILKRIH